MSRVRDWIRAEEGLWRVVQGVGVLPGVLLTTRSMEEAEVLTTHVGVLVQGRIAVEGSVGGMIAQSAES
jgi:ABC-type multidrug transport system ATPase subunit